MARDRLAADITLQDSHLHVLGAGTHFCLDQWSVRRLSSLRRSNGGGQHVVLAEQLGLIFFSSSILAHVNH